MLSKTYIVKRPLIEEQTAIKIITGNSSGSSQLRYSVNTPTNYGNPELKSETPNPPTRKSYRHK